LAATTQGDKRESEDGGLVEGGTVTSG
jgi:hypothetical protein